MKDRPGRPGEEHPDFVVDLHQRADDLDAALFVQLGVADNLLGESWNPEAAPVPPLKVDNPPHPYGLSFVTRLATKPRIAAGPAPMNSNTMRGSIMWPTTSGSRISPV